MVRISYLRWDDDDVCFVLEQHVWLDSWSVSSLKQYFAGKQTCRSILAHYQDPEPTSFAISYVLGCEAVNNNIVVFGLARHWLTPRSTTLEASTVTITPSMWLYVLYIMKWKFFTVIYRAIKEFFIFFSNCCMYFLTLFQIYFIDLGHRNKFSGIHIAELWHIILIPSHHSVFSRTV